MSRNLLILYPSTGSEDLRSPQEDEREKNPEERTIVQNLEDIKRVGRSRLPSGVKNWWMVKLKRTLGSSRTVA